MTFSRIVLAGLFVLFVSGPLAAAETQDRLQVDSGASIKTVLEKKAGSVVRLRLKSGAEITGKLAMVGSSVVQISEVSGMEYFDAVVDIAEIGAVLVRVRSR